MDDMNQLAKLIDIRNQTEHRARWWKGSQGIYGVGNWSGGLHLVTKVLIYQ